MADKIKARRAELAEAALVAHLDVQRAAADVARHLARLRLLCAAKGCKEAVARLREANQATRNYLTYSSAASLLEELRQRYEP